MDSYDSILKEKKVYKDSEPDVNKSKSGKYFFIDLVIIIFILSISYVIYYHKVLTPKNILLYHLEKVNDDLSVIYTPLNIPIDLEQYNYNGTLSFDNDLYQFVVARNKDVSKVSLTRDNKNLIYYNNIFSYVKSVSLHNDKYIQKNDYSIMNFIYNFKHNINDVADKVTSLKKIYLQGYMPIVEVNYVLNQDNLNQLFGEGFIKDSLEVVVTVKINGITGVLVDSKYVVNNKTKNIRNVYNYLDGNVTFVNNNGKKTFFELEKDGDDFKLKISKDDVLFSVLTGSGEKGNYQYAYQIIDKIYNLQLSVLEQDSILYYRFQSNVEDNNKKVQNKFEIKRESNDSVYLDDDVSGAVLYNKFSESEKEKVDVFIDDFVLPIRKFIDEYKDSIY